MNEQDLLQNEQALFKKIKNDILNVRISERMFNDILVIVEILTKQIAYLKLQNVSSFDIREYIQKLAELFALLFNECSKTKENFNRITFVGIELLDYVHSTSAPVYNGTVSWIAENVLKCYISKYRLNKHDNSLLKYLYFPTLFLNQSFFWGDALEQDYESLSNYKKYANSKPFEIYSEEDIVEVSANKKVTIKELLNNNPKFLLLHILFNNSFCIDKYTLYESSQIYKLWKQPIFCFCCHVNIIKSDAEGEYYDQSMLSQYGPQDVEPEEKYTWDDAYWDAGGGNDWSDPTQF